MTSETRLEGLAVQDIATIKDGAATVKTPINIALQGGGSHGAFTWGVLDRLIEDGRLDFAAISGTSAGAMNAVAMADGWMRGGPDGARQKLEDFWRAVARNGRFSPIQRTPWDMLLGNWSVENSPGYQLFENMSRLFSPYVANPLDLNPLRDVVAGEIDFKNVRSNRAIKLFISATNVETGQLRVFEPEEITLDVVMASACLPQIFRAVEIEGVPYWDGGYGGNPALFPFFKANAVEDVLLVQINPIIREGTPKTAQEIQNRIDEITFNSGMLREFRAINFVKELIADGKLSRDDYRDIRMHRIDADAAFKGLSASSKINAEWAFLTYLRDLGRTAADDWLETGLPKVGKEPSVSITEDLDDEPHGKRPTYKRTLGRRVADFMAVRGKPGSRAKRQA
jgi:NTE family protein